MQDLLAELLWRSEEIDEAADRLCRSLPGFAQAEQEFDDLAKQVSAIVGYDLYDRYFTRLTRCTSYEAQAYYALGLGLREEIARSFYSPK